MVRLPLTPADRARGERFGSVLRGARGARSIVDVAAAAGISAETLRKIETGRIPTPAFFTVATLATALELSLDVLVALSRGAGREAAQPPGSGYGRGREAAEPPGLECHSDADHTPVRTGTG